MKIMSTATLLTAGVILALTVKVIRSCENELNYFKLFIESINYNPIRVYAVTKGPDLRRIVAQNEIVFEEKEKFLQFLFSSEEISTPLAGYIYDTYDFQIHERVGESKVRIWDVEVNINKETQICQFWISGGILLMTLHHSALDERLSEEFRDYLDSLGLEN